MSSTTTESPLTQSQLEAVDDYADSNRAYFELNDCASVGDIQPERPRTDAEMEHLFNALKSCIEVQTWKQEEFNV